MSLEDDLLGTSEMTAEVALLNKTAVALAADSAMTLGGSGKTYPAQKLFALTKHHPVGVMIYNNAEFMGIPWETLIKMYRRSLDDKSRPSVKAYLDDFLEFIAKPPFTTANQELVNLYRIVDFLFRNVIRRAKNADGGDSSLQSAIGHCQGFLEDHGDSPSMAKVDVNKILAGCRSELTKRIDHAFGKFEVTPEIEQSLVSLVGDAIRSAAPTPDHSGLVIAGFGEKEFFPSLVSVTTEGLIGGKLKYDGRVEVDVARDGDPATIVPFAQGEMVTRFMEGIDPLFLKYLGDTMGEASTQVVIEVLKTMDIECSDAIEQAVRQAANGQTEVYLKQTGAFRHEKFVAPIMEIVQHLPKEELADMAEALVNLTALKRRVSLDAETVGGPIDVAVISKGDGLVWIRRKHYFDPTLNQSYLTNHM